MSQYGLVNTIQPPILEGTTQPEIIEFEVNYSSYIERVKHVNTERTPNSRIKAASVRQCLQPKLLHSLCMLGRINGAATADTATDQSVKEWLESRLNAETKDLAARVSDAVNSVKYQAKPRDPAHAPEAYILSVVTALDEHNASEVLKDKEQCKELIKRLSSRLEPPELKQRMSNAMAMWNSEKKGNISFFTQKACEIAEHVNAGEIARWQLKRRYEGNSNTYHGYKYNKEDNRNSKKHKNNGTKQNGKPYDGNGEKRRKQNDSNQWTKPCLNEECPEFHRLRDCKMTSVEEKKRLYQEHRDKQKKKLAILSNTTEPNEHDCFKLEIEGVGFSAIGDTGADDSAISASMLKKILKSNSDINIESWKKPLAIELAVKPEDNGISNITASKAATVDIIIFLPATNIPLRIRSTRFVVVDQNMSEVILGRPLLKILGFDLNEHLKRVRNTIDGKSVSEIEKLRLASARYQGMRYNEHEEDPVSPPEHLVAGFGVDSKESIDEAIDNIVKRAQDNGISEEGLGKLRQTLLEHRDVFRIKLGPDPPANVQPLLIKPVDNAKPMKSAQRRYAPDQRVFISHTISQLEKQGAVYKNNNARWASPALAVPKPGTQKLRFTVDLRVPNSMTQPLQPNLPHFDSALQDVKEGKLYANIDFCHGYWQMPLAKESQEMMSIQTPSGIYTPTRVLQGGTDSGNHFQCVTRDKFATKVTNLIQWLDDFLIYAKTEQELLQQVGEFLRVCNEVGFKVNPIKSSFFETKVRFCGRIISATGIKYDPRNINALKEMKKPQAGPDLQQFLCALNWMRTAIPDYSRSVQPLQDLMETVYQKAGSRTKRGIRKISVADNWNEEHEKCFSRIISQLARSTELAHQKPHFDLCLFTDASDTHWASILTQRPREDKNNKLEDQRHEPLGFNSGSFKGASLNWSVPEKEGFAVVESMCRFNYIIANNLVSIFTDHANLVYIYNPIGHKSGVARHTASKLMRWALKLSEFRYEIEYLEGKRNVWADMLTRWAAQPIEESTNSCTIKKLMLAPISPSTLEEFDWPTLKQIETAQKQSTERNHSNNHSKDGLVILNNGRIWIPSDAQSIKQRLLIAAHAGPSGHRGTDATLSNISAKFFWASLRADVEQFTKSCLHCLCTDTGETVPRPLGHSLHASAPNELIHFDYCYMGKSETGEKYVLIIKDDLSGYVWLKSTNAATASTTADILLSWFASFGIANTWVSDQGSHFKNELIKKLQERLKCKHHFTIPYCPWSNGSVERVCRELLRACRALSSEFQLPSTSWPSIIPLIQSVLNCSPVKRLNGRCPLTIFTGLPQDSPILAIVRKEDGISIVRDIKEARANALIEIEKTRTSLGNLHRECAEAAKKRRTQAVRSHNQKTGVREINFHVGDYVLRGSLSRERSSKLNLKWTGPYRVCFCRDNYIFEVEHLLSGKREFVHGRRLKLFRNKDFEVSEEVKEHLSYQQDELLVVDSFDDIRKIDDRIELYVKWQGFTDEERDWVTLDSLREDVPELLEEYLTDISKCGTKRQKSIVSKIENAQK